MATVLLLRHGLTKMTGPVLAGRMPGVHLDDRGQGQAMKVAERFGAVPFARIVSSPLERCKETARAVAGARAVSTDKGLLECDYGDWTGKEIKVLSKDPLWPVVQAHPSSATFPGGESMAAMQARAVATIRKHDAQLKAEDVWLACSHGDVIKAILADALGMHLDAFQRINVDPCSISVIRYTPLRPFVLRVNDTGADASAFMAAKTPKTSKRSRTQSSDAVVGGGAGN